MLKSCDVQEMKSGSIKLSCTRKLMSEVARAAKFVNREHLVRTKMTDRDAIRLHNAVKHMFHAPKQEKKTRRLKA